MNYLDELTNTLLKGDISFDKLEDILQKYETFFDNIDLEIELLKSNGYPIYIHNNNISLKTRKTPIEDQVFCIVDIEVSSPSIQTGQIIEIGAIRYKNGKILEKYNTLVNGLHIPYVVQKITSITPDMLENAPHLRTVLEEFKIFVDDDIIVAHNINFDYKYLSKSLDYFDLGKLANRSLCTIELSKKLFKTSKYGLKYLCEFFDIKNSHHHRAYDDAYNTSIIFGKCLEKLPKEIKTVEDLINFR